MGLFRELEANWHKNDKKKIHCNLEPEKKEKFEWRSPPPKKKENISHIDFSPG